MDKIIGYAIELSRGVGITLSLFALTIIISIPLGFLCSLGSLSKNKPLKWFINTYVFVFRGTPLLLQIMFLYYGLGLSGMPIDKFLSALISLTINYAAYFSEIFRGGIQSIPRGQYEAADVLGLTKKMTTRRIIFPQVLKIVFPSIGNEVINLVKDTALVSIIALTDLLKFAQSALNRDGVITPFIVAAIFYLAINFVVTYILRKWEKRFSYYK